MICVEFDAIVAFNQMPSFLNGPDDTGDLEFSRPVMLLMLVELFGQIHDGMFQLTIVITVDNIFDGEPVFLHELSWDLVNGDGISPFLTGINVVQ